MGFEPDMAQRVLLKHKGDVAKAIEELVSCGGNISSPESADQSPSTSSGASGSTPSGTGNILSFSCRYIKYKSVWLFC
jgi:hypothetical protein